MRLGKRERQYALVKRARAGLIKDNLNGAAKVEAAPMAGQGKARNGSALNSYTGSMSVRFTGHGASHKIEHRKR
jgi:hypothetical protein